MTYNSLVSKDILFFQLENPDWVVIDCRFKLTDPEMKKIEYLNGHIPGARYANLDQDLSAPVIQGETGRHPLPDVSHCEKCFSEWGIGPDKQVVVYDDAGGAIAARLWWLLQWLGHKSTAILNGGWNHWTQAGFPTEKNSLEIEPIIFSASIPKKITFNTQEIVEGIASQTILLIDARNAERFRGENESIDPISGHIPGSFNAPYENNLDSEGLWKTSESLRHYYLKIFPQLRQKRIVSYCGSGVTACHNFFSLQYAGFNEIFLYPGSWSEWITNPGNPIALGND